MKSLMTLTRPAAFELTGKGYGNQTIKIIKGGFIQTLSVNLLEGANSLSTLQTTLPSQSGGGDELDKSPCCVTGDDDAIENVLAKLGLGDVDVSGALVLGTEAFDLADGAAKLNDEHLSQLRQLYHDTSGFSTSTAPSSLGNCGNHYEDEVLCHERSQVAALEGLGVEGGGRLYCTDWSYDFCEQLFPEQVDFASFTAGDGFAAAPETRDEAQVGRMPILLSARARTAA